MAMQPTIYSMNGLSVELGIDRRTVAKRLRGVAPDGKTKNGHDGWTLATALEAFKPGRSKGSTPAAPPAPAEIGGLTNLNPVDQAAALALVMLCERSPAVLAALAVDRGLVPASAGPALLALSAAALTVAAQDVADETGIEVKVAPQVHADRVRPVAWERFDGFDPKDASRRLDRLKEN